MKQLRLIYEKFSEAFLACALAMVQGDLSVFTLKHAMVASKTGLLTGIGFMFASLISELDNKWGNALMTGLITAIADIIIHPTHFGPAWTESVVIGSGAGILALLFIHIFHPVDNRA